MSISKQLMSNIDGIDHISYAVRNTDETIKLLEIVGFNTELYRKPVEELGIYASKLMNSKSEVIELVEPMGNKPSPVDEMVSREKAVLYHVCFKVNEFENTRKKLINDGAVTVTGPFESYLFDGYSVSHMYHPSLGLFEIFGEMKNDKNSRID